MRQWGGNRILEALGVCNMLLDGYHPFSAFLVGFCFEFELSFVSLYRHLELSPIDVRFILVLFNQPQLLTDALNLSQQNTDIGQSLRYRP